MAINRWLGDATAVAQVITLTVGGTVAPGDTVSYTIGNSTTTVTAGGSDVEIDLAAAFAAALQASSDPRFKEVSWTYVVGEDFVTGTASNPGTPFEGTTGDTGTTTLTPATVTASTGPSQVDEALNWSLGTVPGAGDDVLIDAGADLLYFGTLAAAAYNSFRVKASFTGNIGLPYWNQNGYVEYRTRAYPIDTAVPVTVGQGSGTGPTRCYLSCGSVLNLTVLLTGVRQIPSVPVLNVYGCSSGTIHVASGDVGVAADEDTQSGTVTTATVNDGATFTVGTSAVVTTCNQDGATILSYGTITTVNSFSGTTTLYNAPTTITADAGKVLGYFTGTVTTATFRGQGNPQTDPVLDFSNDSRARTITNCTFTGGGYLLDPDKTITFSNAGTWDAASLSLTNFGPRFSLLRS